MELYAEAINHGNTLLRLKSLTKAFTRAEQKVAEVVLNQTDNVIYLSVTELAELAGVGETTILRFCRKIGFKGYQDFKLSLAKELVNPIKNFNPEVSEEDDLLVIVQKVTATNIQAVKDTMALVDPVQLERAVSSLEKARKLHFYGVGSSGVTALDAKYKFLRIGLPVDAYYDTHMQAMAAATLGKEDVAVGISVSGSTKDTVDSLRIARESGATVICVTQYARSPITRIANIVLLTAGREAPLQGGAFSSKIAQLQVIDLLSTLIALRNKERAIEFKQKTAKAVSDKNY